MERPERAAGTARPGTLLAERVTVLFLLLAVLLLAWVRWMVIPARRPPAAQAFDFANPMRDAQVGECVEVESEDHPGDMYCYVVRDLVLRPHEGPDRVGRETGLRRAAPYLLCTLRYPPPGKGCATSEQGPVEWDRFGLNDFGMPASTEVMLVSLRGTWVERGGEERFVYEAELQRFGYGGGRWVVYLSPDAPVTGTVYRLHSPGPDQIRGAVFREVPGCR